MPPASRCTDSSRTQGFGHVLVIRVVGTLLVWLSSAPACALLSSRHSESGPGQWVKWTLESDLSRSSMALY
jgi:hypothetical protein